MTPYDQVGRYYDEHDRVLGMSLATLRRMKGARVEPIAGEILGYLQHRGIVDPAARYREIAARLHHLQDEFERTGHYAARRYAEIPPLDREQYHLGLLMSFIVTVHRFEILEALLEFLRAGCPGPRRLLVVGYGTGYELRWVREILPDWTLDGFDDSPAAAAYARDLLTWFGHSADGLREDVFPLETDRGIEAHAERYGKAILCELIEHLERPAHALRNLRRALHPQGHAFVTVAINIAQEDHIYLCTGLHEARALMTDNGLRIAREWVLPMSVLPIADDSREAIFRKGNYACIVERA